MGQQPTCKTWIPNKDGSAGRICGRKARFRVLPKRTGQIERFVCGQHFSRFEREGYKVVELEAQND